MLPSGFVPAPARPSSWSASGSGQRPGGVERARVRRSGLVRAPGPAASPRSRRMASSGPAASRIASRSAAARSRSGSSSRVAPAPSRTPCRVAGPRRPGPAGRAATASAAGGLGAAAGRSRQKLARRAVPPATQGGDGRRLRRGPGALGEAGDPGELGVGGAGQLPLDGDQGQPLGLETLDGDELEQVPLAVQGGPAAMGDRTVDQADGRVPADGPPVRDGTHPAAGLAVVVDGQRHVDPLGELVKGPAWFLHVPYDDSVI